VSTPVFAGPIDLLIYLVQHDEIDIFAFALRTITSEYVEHLGGLDERDIEEVGEFMVMAAQLMEIKSMRLLPPQPKEEGEEEEVGDPRAMLLARLMEYKRFRTVADELRERAEAQRWVFSRNALNDGNGNGQAERPHLMLGEVSPFDLWAAFQSVLNRVSQAQGQGEVVRPRFTVAQKMAAVAAKVRWARERLRFVDLFREDATVVEVIVTFLAILELIRLRRIQVVQEGLFGEIWVQARASSEEA
jgi:segregation and condensation protein A